MPTTTRTDVHSPTNLVTEDYEFVACGYYGSAGEPGYSPLVHEAQYLIDEGWAFGENESAGDCYHCGARLKYYAILKHLPSHTLVRVGETCLANRFDRASTEFHRLRKQAELDRAAHRVKRARLAWFAVDPDREVAFTWAGEQVEQGHYGYEGMRHTFVSKVNRYGETSDKFVRAIMRDMARTERFAEERAAREAAEAAVSSPVVEGRIEITGEVLSVKLKENDYGSRLVMTVRDDRGFKVWGTVPAALEDITYTRPLDTEGLKVAIAANLERHEGVISGTYYLDLANEQQAQLDAGVGRQSRRCVQRGERVVFTATVEKSDDDETFGFFKRPSKAQLLGEPAPPECEAEPVGEISQETRLNLRAMENGAPGVLAARELRDNDQVPEDFTEQEALKRAAFLRIFVDQVETGTVTPDNAREWMSQIEDSIRAGREES